MFKRWMWIVVLSSTFAQCIFFTSTETVFAVGCVVSAWALTDKLLLTNINISKYTLSTVVILGFSLTQFFIPISFTLIEGKPLVFNLDYSYDVFIHSLLSLITLLIAHILYKSWRKDTGLALFNWCQRILNKTELYSPKTDLQVWLMGFIGTVGLTAKAILGYSDDNVAESGGDSLTKFIIGFKVFSYAPYFLLIKELYNLKKAESYRTSTKGIVLYTLLLMTIGMASNSRGTFMAGITAFAIAYLVGLLLGKVSYKIFTPKNISWALVGLWLLTGPLVDLGTAMVIVRGQRSSMSGSELVSQTLTTFQNKEALTKYRELARGRVRLWDEHYFDNIFLSRFSNLKYNDLSLGMANKIGSVDDKMQEYSIDRIFTTFPQPILSALQINVDKKVVNSSSFGDYLYYRASGGGLGGFRLGQFAGTGMTSFGWWYLLILAAGIIPVYFLLDLFVTYSAKTGKTLISLAGLVSITSTFTLLSLSSLSESVVNLFSFIIRGWIQLVVLYLIVAATSRFISYMLIGKK
ncbi:hypothetical protein [Telluribacter sp. SYSU D00476]|uniref:hypothetical protein n=1 Tax=Telluribacter sp. SYSU D00476 TaxID=2811430 RepID=UPI001FF2CB54|nr:hypothetical protein [Telluribacter sp. SYSU D00476]